MAYNNKSLPILEVFWQLLLCSMAVLQMSPSSGDVGQRCCPILVSWQSEEGKSGTMQWLVRLLLGKGESHPTYILLVGARHRIKPALRCGNSGKQLTKCFPCCLRI